MIGREDRIDERRVDLDVKAALEAIRQEEVPERIRRLAIQLQEKLDREH